MSPIRHRRPALRRSALTPTQRPTSLGSESALVPVPNNDLFQEFMRTSIEKVRGQTLAALATPATEARDDTDRLLKPRNLDL